MKTVYVVVAEDRHCDPTISVHLTREGADERVEKHKAQDAKRYEDIEWSEEPRGQVIGAASSWVFYLRSFDDGPNIRIEQQDLEP